MNKMREKFENLEDIRGILDENPEIKFHDGNYVYRGTVGPIALVACYIAGAWYAFQEQQKEIDREWTDIKDKLPPFDDDGARPCYRLLVTLTHGTVTEVSYWGKGQFYLNGSLVEGVKYWMLLPNSPI